MSQADMFLKIEGARQGAIKGESRDANHEEEIEVLGWDWGMEGNRVDGSPAPRTVVRELKVIKRVDAATTGLMAALRSNEVLRRATLVVRKSGGDEPLEYFKLIMESGRITGLRQHCPDGTRPPVLAEELSIAFGRFTVEYKAQGDDGLGRGASSFEMDVYENT